MENKKLVKPEMCFGPDAAEEEKARRLRMYSTKLMQAVRAGEVDSDKLIELVAMAKGSRSQRKFADDIGVNVSSLSRILSGKVKEVSNDLLAKIAAAADSASGVTLEMLMEAQGIIPKDERGNLVTKFEDNCRRIFSDELLKRGYSVSYAKESRMDHNMQRWDFEVVTDALTHGEGRWLVDTKMTTQYGRFPVGIGSTRNWLYHAMAYYYRGGVAGRISIIIDNNAVFEQLKERLSELTLKDEISVILISTAAGRILDEYIAPLTDGREGKEIFGKNGLADAPSGRLLEEPKL